MKYHELKTTANRPKKRIGRGISAGQGKTAGRGTKGQKSRTGWTQRPGFSGGQNPLLQQLPKLPGFRSYRKKAENVTLDQISSIKSKDISSQTLADSKLISSPFARVKLLANGKITTAKTVRLESASQAAIDAISKAGGSFEQVARLDRPKTTKRAE